MNAKHTTIANIVLFQSAWFAGALYTTSAIWFMLTCLVLNLAIGKFNQRDVVLVVLGGVGFGLDLILIYFGLFTLNSPHTPFWLLLIWCLFTLSLNYSLSFITRIHSALVFALGAIFGPASYLAAAKFGAINYPHELTLIMIHSAFWGVTLYILSIIVKRYRYGKAN